MEALITRRGGAVKRGSLTAPLYSPNPTATIPSYYIQDPALVGVRNAIIYLAEGGMYPYITTSTKSAVASIVIESGNVTSCTRVNENLNTYPIEGATFDPNTGTINCKHDFFVTNRTTEIPAYDYIIFD